MRKAGFRRVVSIAAGLALLSGLGPVSPSPVEAGGTSPQSITFDAIPYAVYGDPPMLLAATASSGLPVSYVTSGPCTVSGTTLTLTGTGTCTVIASQAGDATWAAAPDVSRGFTIAAVAGPTSVSAGFYSSCAVLADGTVRCWGNNAFGLLGDGTTIARSVPVPVAGIANATAVSVGPWETCALLADGTVRCWGLTGLPGASATTAPVPVPGISSAVAISTGADHACALLLDGTISCWGSNNYGQLGDGTTSDSSTPVIVPGVSNAIAISAGLGHTCAVLADGTIRCWGSNAFGQLGDGTAMDRSTPVPVAGISRAVAVDAGGVGTCAVLSDSTVRCWGGRANGEFEGVWPQSSAPVAVDGLSSVINISAGLEHTCAVLAGGGVRCWGLNGTGDLGDGTVADSITPVPVAGISGAVAVSAGEAHTCAIVADGSIRCWGLNSSGQLGDATETARQTPVAVVGISGAVAVSAGSGHTCALRGDGTVSCWGDNDYGQLGDGTIAIARFGPVAVGGISGVIAVSADGVSTCALLGDGTVSCWGDDEYGQLGDGSTTNSAKAVTVPGISTAVAVSTGYDHACALLSEGSIRCWGMNGFGELGDGTTTNRLAPVAVSGLSSAVAVSAGGFSTCALLADGTIRCWGVNWGGELGDGTTTSRSAPVEVSGISNAVAISVGYEHACAVLSDGTIRCWGQDDYGQLGDGTTIDQAVPAAVSGISTAVAVSAGYQYTCALLADGTLRCWGANDYGQLGDGNTTSSRVPVTVTGISNAIGITAGDQHACAALTDGTIACWGWGGSGQLGDGTTGIALTPVAVPAFVRSPQTISFEPLQDATYGPPVALGATASSGLPVSYSASGSCSASGSMVSLQGVGLCTVTASQIGGAAWLPASSVSQSFTIAPARLTVRADDKSKTWGAPNPALTYSVTGFVNGETAAVLSGSPDIATSASTTSPQGMYGIAISVGSLAAANYTFALVPGTLTISGCPPLRLDATTEAAAILGHAEGLFESSLAPGCTISTAAASSNGAISDLAAGRADIAAISRPLTSAEASSLYGWQFASDGLVFAVEDSSSMSFLSGLSSAQVTGIYSGTITNWNQLGGPDQPIVVRAGAIGSDARADLLRLFGVSEAYEQATVTASGQPRFASPAEAVEAAKANPYEIVYTSLYETQADGSGLKVLSLDGVTPSVAAVQDGTYPAIRSFWLVMRADEFTSSSGTNSVVVKAQDLVNFLFTSAGQLAIWQGDLDGVNLPSAQPIPSIDVNLDGAIGLADLGDIIAHWGQASSCQGWIRADVNDDGGVGLADIGRVIASWGGTGFVAPAWVSDASAEAR